MSRKDKWQKILLLSPLFIIFSFGESLSEIIGNVLFVEHIGAEYLPYTYLAGAFISGFLVLLISSLLEKMSPANLLQLFAWLGSGLFFGYFWLMKTGHPWVYSIFLVSSTSFYLILTGTVIWIIANNICSLFESRALFVYYSLSASLGGILAGFLTYQFTEPLGLENMILLVSISLVISGIILIFVQRAFGDKFALNVDEQSIEGSKWQQLAKGFRDFKKSNLAKLLFVVLTLFNIIWWISDFEYQKIVGGSLTENAYSRMSGILTIINSASIMLMLMFVQNWIIKRKGIVNTLFISPAVVLIAFILLFLMPTPKVALAANIVTPLIGYSIFSNSSRFIFTALPHAIRNSVISFISGNADAVSALIAGLGLLILTRFVDNSVIIAAGCMLLVVSIIIIMIMRKEYLKQVLKNLDGGDQIDIHGAIENLAEPAYQEIGMQELMKMIQWRKLDIETVRKIIFALGKIDNIEAIPGLLQMMGKYDASVKYTIVETIHSFSKLSERLRKYPFTKQNIIEMYEKIFLDEPDTELKVFILENLRDFDQEKAINFLCNAINDVNIEISRKAISSMRFFHDRGIISYVKPHLEDKNPAIVAAAIIALFQFKEFRVILIKNINQIMSGTSKDEILAALDLIGKLEFKWELNYVSKYLDNADFEISRQATLTLLQLGDDRGIGSVAEALSNLNNSSIFFARALKDLPKVMKEAILKEVKKRGEHAANACAEILKSSYLNFTGEIDFLSNQRGEIVSTARPFGLKV